MDLSIVLRPKQVSKGLGLFSVGLLLSGIVSHCLKYSLAISPWLYRWFNVDGEKNIPAAFSSLLLLGCGLLLLLITIAKNAAHDSYTMHWGGLAVIFGVFAVDEWLSFHEKLSDVVSNFVATSGVFHFSWIIPGLAFIAILSVAYWKFLADLTNPYRWLFLRAGVVYISGAIGMEAIAGSYVTYHQSWSRLIWLILSTIEEGLEMLGVILFIYALIDYIQTVMGTFSVQIQSLKDPNALASSQAQPTNFKV